MGAVILLDDRCEPRGSLVPVCGSNLRFRSIISVLMRKLFDDHKVLSQCHDPTISGIGMSDSEVYAQLLAGAFDYENTYCHKAPKLISLT